MVKDPTLEREEIGGREPMGDPAETEPQTTREGSYGDPKNPDDPMEELRRERPNT